MAKSDARFGYRADLGREVHDLSAPLGFTTVPGMLNPIFEDIATPGDTYYINHDLTFMRTQPLLGPAMIDVKVHVESFFVPFPLIYQPIETALFGITTNFSSLFGATPQTLVEGHLLLYMGSFQLAISRYIFVAYTKITCQQNNEYIL